jgi:phage terminase small subunit
MSNNGGKAKLGNNALTVQQERFVREYFKDFNAKKAARRAGYSAKTVDSQGAQLLSNPKVLQAIEQQQAVLARKLDLSSEKVLRELAKIGFANMRDFLTIGPDGQPVLNWAELTHDQAAALSEVTVTEVPSGGRKVRFRLHDKRQALVDLGKHLGLFVERSQVTVVGDPVEAGRRSAQAERLIAVLQDLADRKSSGEQIPRLIDVKVTAE